MKLNYKFILILLTFIAPSIAFAFVFDPPTSDKSMQYLGALFGKVGSIRFTGGEYNPALAQIFEKLNFIVITIGSVIISYTGVVSTINTAQEGQAMGKKWSSTWLPLRSILGILLMVPGASGGYSVVQIFIMFLITQGVGAADVIWAHIYKNLYQGLNAASVKLDARPFDKLETDVKADDGSETSYIKNLYKSAICAETIKFLSKNQTIKLTNNKFTGSYKDILQKNLNDDINGKSEITVTVNGLSQYSNKVRTISINKTKKSSEEYIGIDNETPELQGMCGIYKIEGKYDNKSNPEINADNRAEQIYSAKLVAHRKALAIARNFARSILKDLINKGKLATDYNEKFSRNRNTLLAEYFNEIQTLVDNQPDKKLKETDNGYEGWISAGYMYADFANRSDKNSRALMPDAKTVPILKTTSNSNNNSHNPIEVNITNSIKELKNLLANEFDVESLFNSEDKPKSDKAINIINSLKDILITGTKISFTETSVGPPTASSIQARSKGLTVFALKLFISNLGGDKKAGIASPLIVAGTSLLPIFPFGTAFGTGLLTGGIALANAASKDNVDPIMSIRNYGHALSLMTEIMILSGIVTIFTLTAIMMSPLGLSPLSWSFINMSLWLVPMVLSVALALWSIGQMMSVYIPMIPYIIFATATLGWFLFVIEAMIAAPLIALGLVIPSGDELGKVTAAIGILTNVMLRPMLMIIGFIFSIRMLYVAIEFINHGILVHIDRFDLGETMFSFLTVMALYLMFIISIINKCFSLIYLVPDKILRWIGGSAEQTSVSDELGAAKSGYETGSKATSGAMQGAAEGLASKGSTIAKEKEEEQKADKAKKAKNGGGSGAPAGGGAAAPAPSSPPSVNNPPDLD